MIKLYTKIPVTIEAIQLTKDNYKEVLDFCNAKEKNADCNVDGSDFLILTLEGTMHASIGDYIIKGVKGEFYPCKPDIFEQTYKEIIFEE